MQEVFEKIIEKLEGEARFYNSASDVDQNIRSGVIIAKDVVQEEAEEYNNGWIPFSERFPECEKDGYNKAIDDFAEKIIRYVDCGHLCSPTEIRWSDLAVVEMVKELAEQLKGR